MKSELFEYINSLESTCQLSLTMVLYYIMVFYYSTSILFLASNVSAQSAQTLQTGTYIYSEVLPLIGYFLQVAAEISLRQ